MVAEFATFAPASTDVTCSGARWNGGASGIRTRDLLVANETRYQLRHSPRTVHQDSTSGPTTSTSRTVALVTGVEPGPSGDRGLYWPTARRRSSTSCRFTEGAGGAAGASAEALLERVREEQRGQSTAAASLPVWSQVEHAITRRRARAGGAAQDNRAGGGGGEERG